MLVDCERVLLRLKGELQVKRSWGRDELCTLIARLEAESVLDGDDVPQPPSDEEDGTRHEGPLPDGAAERPPRGMPGHEDPLLAEGARNGNEHREAVGSRR